MNKSPVKRSQVLFIEPFYGGSHKELIDILIQSLYERGIEYTLVTLPAKKWHWRARCSALVLHDRIPKISTEKVLFCSSVLNLPELLGLRPDLHGLKKIVYFHENQLIYPVQEIKSRDVQYSYNNITTSLAADRLLFNSNFNRTSFLENIDVIVKMLPDNRPKEIRRQIEQKSEVLYFPVKILDIPMNINTRLQQPILHILWPHRWEFDKGPDDFFTVIRRLKQNQFSFRLSVLGQKFMEVPEIFNKIKLELKDEIIIFDYLECKKDYFKVLNSSHVVVSTAKHEFFGISIMEATYCGCLPLLPAGLVYPEIYPCECLYSSLDELFDILKRLCLDPNAAIDLRAKLELNLEKFSPKTLLPKYINALEIND